MLQVYIFPRRSKGKEVSLCLVIPTCRGYFGGYFELYPDIIFIPTRGGILGDILNYTLVDELGLTNK